MRYIDFSGFPSADFLELIYYGSRGNTSAAAQLMELWIAELVTPLDVAFLLADMKAAWRMYHVAYFDRFGSTERLRDESGEVWVETSLGEGGGGDIFVRSRYIESYSRARSTEFTGGLLILQAASRAEGVDPTGSSGPGPLLDGMIDESFGKQLRYFEACASFLDAYAEEYPATVQHFEGNLERASMLQALQVIERLEVQR
ncbi:hypothetical protein Pla86_13070 [Planctomycetes bacterium Pla86]|uniref:Uncharacterized protein n=1 Tax=Engelhardtia mirabilis TaxID=2528011 RepID=A0A518BGY8_9BACT|nr:hypothetical protein Pla133_13070 [Planctomycetes bacterium Pla133]QDV00568.1 hypothetical protein Pla86_13070 [Planctomycetes bacterium Pla86]